MTDKKEDENTSTGSDADEKTLLSDDSLAALAKPDADVTSPNTEDETSSDVSGAAATSKVESAIDSQIASETETKETKIEETTKEETKTKESSNGTSWLAILFAIVALGLVAFLGWMLLQQKGISQSLETKLNSQHNQLQQFQNALSDNQTSVSSQLAQRDQTIDQLKESLVEAHLSIDSHSRRLLSLTATTTDDWRLAEVEYLLRLANQRILTSKDSQTALNLLKSADQILLELGDPRLYKVRHAIANDRAAIALVGEQDLEGAFLELSALSKQINSLPVLVAPTFTAEPETQSADQVENSDTPQWLQTLKSIATSTWVELKSLVAVQNVTLILSPCCRQSSSFI